MKDNYGCTNEKFANEFRQYIDGFNDTYDKDEHYSNNDRITEAFLIGADISDYNLSRWDKGKLARYRNDMDKR